MSKLTVLVRPHYTRVCARANARECLEIKNCDKCV